MLAAKPPSPFDRRPDPWRNVWAAISKRKERLVVLDSLGMECRLARDERRAGVDVERLDCPLLIVPGTADTQWPAERYRDLHLQADSLTVEGASHWGLVLNRRVLRESVCSVARWLDTFSRVRWHQRRAERVIGLSTPGAKRQEASCR